jgi:phosphatidylglycerophosphate synthase
MKYSEFQKYSFPEKSALDRAQFDFFTNLTKWFAMRLAFIFFRIGLKANTLDILGIIGSVCGAIILVSSYSDNIYLSLIGISLLAFGIFVDFIDGPIARARGESSQLGDALDDLGVDVVKSLLLVVFAVFSKIDYMIVLSILTIMVLIVGLPKTSKIIIKNHYWKGSKFKLFLLKVFFASKYSALGVRIMIPALLLSLSLILIFNINFLTTFSAFITMFYITLSMIWLALLIFSNNSKK